MKVVSATATFVLLLLLARLASADFTATTLGDYGNITVMEVLGNYDENKPDGTINSGPRQAIAKEFFRLHKDEYDFLVIFTNFNFTMRPDAVAFYKQVKNDTQGIGLQIFDNSSFYGSNGKLQGTIDMGSIDNLVMDPLNPAFDFTLDTISHEMIHRWAAHVKFRKPDGSISTALLGKDGSHWSFLLNTDASLMYGNTWRDNGDGTFTSIKARKYYSPLDLYLMGFIDKTEVPPMFLIENSSIDPARSSETGVTITGIPRYVTIEDIIAAEGERIPGSSESQKNFKTAFIFITSPGTFTGDELYGLETVRNGWVTRYSVLTDGAGLVQVASTPLDNIPTNPGVLPPGVTPRTLPPNIEEGVAWLMSNQKADGNWIDLAQTTERDTAEAVLALKNFAVAQQNNSLGIQWLNGTASDNSDYLSRKIEVMAQSGQDVTQLLQTLVSRQNGDGGWGSNKEYMSNTPDTAVALKALSAAGHADQSIIGKAISYLKAKQNPDQGWGSDGASTIQATANVLSALNAYKGAYPVTDNIAQAVAWLVAKQNPDGGFGNSPSTVYDTAQTLLTLGAVDISRDITNKAVQYILSSQSGDGSWNASPYQTALAIEAIWKATVDPDLAIRTSDITFTPTQVTILPSTVVINANISNLGRTNVPQAKVELYMGDPPIGTKIGEQAVAFPGQSTASVTFPVTLTEASEYKFYISVDPENLVKESSKTNNTAMTTIKPEAGSMADLSIKSGDITFTPPIVTTLPAAISVNANMKNLGRAGVSQVRVVLYDGAIAEANRISETLVDFPGLSTVAVSFPVTVMSGYEHIYFISIDPDNLINESSKTNNRAGGVIRSEATYDFEIAASDITFSGNPVDIFNNVKIATKIRNSGMMNVYNVQVKYYIDEGGSPFGIATATIDIPANSTVTNEITWKASKTGVNLPITVQADPLNLFAELSKENNKAVAYLTVNGSTEPNLTISYKDMVITPNPADERGNANISVLVKNEGFSAASNVQVSFYKGVPGVDGVLLGTQVIPTLNTGESSRSTFDWTNIMDAGERIVYVKVDPAGQIAEISKDDNDAFVMLDILSLPDLAISANSIIVNPAAPKDGDTVAIMVTIKNLGRQSASNVSVKAVDGNTTIGTNTIPSIAGNSQETVSFSYNTAGKSGAHQIAVFVDLDNVIVEQSEDNNAASRTFGVQNANLWLTEPIISPNGDGIKDSTQLFFRLSAPQTVKVNIVNKRSEIVRTFSGAGLTDTTSGSITWDGLNNIGTVVADGQYQIKVVDASNSVLGSLLVVVDNNRSPLSDALGTKYLLNNNLTCMLPDIYQDDWKWLPDESGIVFKINYPDQNTPEYPAGLYTMAPDGEDIIRLVPYSDNPNEWRVSNFDLSPKGDKIAFISSNKLWIVDSDGNNLTILDESLTSSIRDVKWSPDGKYLLYNIGQIYNYLGYSAYELWIVDVYSRVKTKIDWGYLALGLDSGAWSPDSQHIAYLALSDSMLSTQGWQVDELKVSDLNGNKSVISTFNTTTWYTLIAWVGNEMIALQHPTQLNQLWAFDSSGNGEHIVISEKPEKITHSTNKKNLAFLDYSVDKAMVKIFDNEKKITVVYEKPLFKVLGEGGYYSESYLTNMIWSRDGKRFAFIDKTYKKIDSCIYEPHVIVVDASTKTSVVHKVFDSEYTYTYSYSYSYSYDTSNCADPQKYRINKINELVSWLSDNENLLTNSEKGYFDINAVTGERGGYLLLEEGIAAISPLGRYINYYRTVDQSSICYGRGWQDLWAMSSLLNLTADLRLVKNKSAIILKGSAADLNFDGYMLEYADAKSPSSWNLVKPPSDVPVINGEFTTWVPPYEGVFYVRLTVWDRAGNVAREQKRVSWGLSSSITNIYKSAEIFSPNGDGTKDTVSLNYTVLEPVHLEFYIYDENNNRLRTFFRDYTAPVADNIMWDGRDESSRIVPDGKYTIKVFDYEFFVEVDNTPPDANIELSEIKQDVTLSGSGYSQCKYPITPLVAYLTGHAYDKNLKNWVIEYGEGDNPQEWTTQLRGQDPLVGTDEAGNPILQPTKDVDVGGYIDQDIAELTGKRFRITVEDHAGNKSTLQSNMLEERMLLYFHSWGASYSCDHEYFKVFESNIYPELQIPQDYGHTLEGIETIRQDLTSINLQYWSGKQWHDAVQEDYSSDGIIFLAWDRDKVMSPIGAVRLKALDIFGQEHYSNKVLTQSSFGIDSCKFEGRNYLFEELKVMKLQIRSARDTRYAQWTDYKVFNAPDVPRGVFNLYPLPPINPGMSYDFRMLGIDKGGKEYIAEDLGDSACLNQSRLAFKLYVGYNEADCGQTSDGKARLSADLDVFQALSMYLIDDYSLKTLSYYIRKPEGLQLLGEFDVTSGVLPGIAIDTAGMPEGIYTVTAVLSYIDLHDYSERELTAANELIVDRVLPEARTTYPDKSQTLCPVKRTDAMGEWFVIPVEGIAQDNTGVKKYELYYGFGEAPQEWKPALERIVQKNIVQKNKVIFAPISVMGKAVKGKLGDWYVEGIHGTVSLKLKVIDITGNVTCYTTTFTVKDVIDFANPIINKYLFSPNGDGILDEVNVTYEINEYATVDQKVYPLTLIGNDYVLGQSPVGTIASGISHLGGEGYTVWNGMTDAGTAPDGHYGITVLATDSCGNTRTRWTHVEVDNTPPLSAISYPRQGDPIGNIVEVKGTASDTHFRDYLIEAAPAGSTNEWRLIANGANPVTNDVLGTWNTYGLNGTWTLRLTVSDTVGNRNETSVDIDLGARKDLIKDLNITPKIFSPNHDGKLEAATIKYEVAYACTIQAEIRDSAGNIKKSFIGTTPSAGNYQIIWDGTDTAGTPVPDGPYIVKLTASLTANPSVNQFETVTVAVDTKAPVIDMKQPVSGSHIKTDVSVNGSLSDPNIMEYTMTVLSETGSEVLDHGNQERTGYNFGILSSPAEGAYTLNIKTKDLAENATEVNIPFVIDRTPPKVAIDTPKTGDYFGHTKAEINVSGSIGEKNLESFELRYGNGDSPAQWAELLKGAAVPMAPQIFTWKVGRNDNISDGNYTLSLLAKDKAGLTGEAKVKVIVDNTAPETVISAPVDRGYVKSALDIKGTAFDANLDKYTAELSEGSCQSAFKWSALMSSTKSIKDDVLAKMQILPADGEYCIKVSAIDKLANKSEARSKITIDTQPPSAPVLSGKIEDRTDVRLTWAANTEPDIAGYDLYRDGKKLNTTLLAGLSFLDADLTEGTYIYILKAVDYAGNESPSSNGVTINIDLTGPNARLRSPQDSTRVGGLVDIKGTAYSQDDFKEYRLYIGRGQSPSTWMLIRTSPVPETYGVLSQWDTAGLTEDEQYAIKLEASDINGNTSVHQITVTIDNRPPAAPLLLTAVPSVSDVQLTWNANTEQDLAGYLLYRNDQLANVQGIVIGNLKPYLIATTSYPDQGLPDGAYKYSLVAMDSAGNMSDQSNTLEVTIDTRPPHAVIVEPGNNAKFDKALMVKAESPDTDIASVRFQYKKVEDTVWLDLGTPVTVTPYAVHIDPAVLGLTYGGYHITAVATDKGGKTDPAPAYVTVTYTDVTAPALPLDLKALVNGADVTLTWISNPGGDLDGYNIYRTSGIAKQKINTAVVRETTYSDLNLADGSYAYEVTSVDTSGNESRSSNSVQARIYAPSIVQPYTPTGNMTLSVTGNSAAANATVQIFAEAVSGLELRGTATSDASGNFAADITLTLGENRLSAKATDTEGNISKASDMTVVVYNEPPMAPTGLMNSVQNHDVGLIWDSNAESDLSGYNIYRDGEKINAPVSITSGTVTASSSDYYNLPARAFDGNPGTSWISYTSYGAFDPAWVQIDLPSPELLSSVEIDWLGDGYAGKDYEIQAWSGYAWITLQKVTGNVSSVNTFDFKPSYRTDKIRIQITDVASTDYYKQAGISEIWILSDNLVAETSYQDLNLGDGKYTYSITTVDYYGFESLPSESSMAAIGDVLPPAAPIDLTAIVSGPDIILTWTPVTEPDVAGYHVYRNTPQGWIKLNSTLLSSNTYTDPDLSNGIYSYKVTAVDNVGNESQPSNEASATVDILDTTPPTAPEIFFPTMAGLPVTLTINKTDVAGFAEPGSSVTLSKFGVSVATITALASDNVSTFDIDYAWGDVTLSPDGKTLAYADSNYSLWIRDIATGETRQITPYGYLPVWSSDGNKIAYHYDEDRNGQQNYLIGIYDIRTGTVTTLTDTTVDPYIDEYSPSMSSDGSRVAFISYQGGSYNVWLKDVMSGAVRQLTYGGFPAALQLSPNGNKLAYIDGDNYYLYVTDIASGESLLIDNNANSDSLDWSPDSRTLLFSSTVNGNVDLYSHDLSMNVRTQLSSNADSEFSAQWSPDGKSILFGQYDSNENLSIKLITSDAPNGRILFSPPGIYGLYWLKSGAISFSDGSVLAFVHPKGHFSYNDIPLDAGENLFSAVSTDSSGNLSQSSDEISVTFETGLLPDLEILSGDIYLYPPVPLAGQQLLTNIVVWNRGQTEAINITADVYIWDATGTMQRIKSVIIPTLSPDSGEIIAVSWGTSGKKGANRLFVVLDPADAILEQREDNNVGEKEFSVVSGEGVSMTTALNAEQFTRGQDVAIGINIVNSGTVREGVIDLSIEDENGYLVTVLDSRNVHLAYGSQEHYAYPWNVGSVYAGQYRVHSLLRDASGILAENIAPFTILPDMAIEASVVTDKALYGPHENVRTTFTINNKGLNYTVPELKVKSVIRDGAGTELFAEEKVISNMLPGASVSLNSVWDTGLTAPGNYLAIVNIYENGQIILSKTAPFGIGREMTVSGSLQVLPSVVLIGNTVQADYTLLNAGNSDAIGLTVKVLIEDPETQAGMRNAEETKDFPMNRSATGQFAFSTQGFGLKTYAAILQYVYQGNTKTLARSSFTVKDGSPPLVTIIAPTSGSLTNTKVDLVVVAADDASGIEKVEFQIDGGAWRLVPVADLSTGRYMAVWTPSQTDEGTHIISFRATDRSGNMSQPVSATIAVDMTPPTLTISTLSDGSWTNNQTLNISVTAHDNGGVQQLTINGLAVTVNPDGSFSSAQALESGANIITTVATDLAGNQSSDTRTINFDQNAPNIVITTPSDNSKTKQAAIEIAGSVDENATVTVILNNGTPVPAQMTGTDFTLPLSLTYGTNTIEARATDRAGNTSTVKRTVTLDDRNPGLSVTEPDQDIRTNQSTVVIKGRVDDLTSVIVTVAVEGEIYNPLVSDGAFEQMITLTTEKAYQIYVEATDETGNVSTVQRNIIYDITPPAVSIDPVTSPTNRNSQVVSGTVEAGAIVSVTCATANVGPVAYPAPAIWSVTLTDMAEENNQVIVTASDAAGNVSQNNVSATILVDTVPPDTMITDRPADPSGSSSASFSFISTEEGSTFQCSLDGGNYMNCGSPAGYADLSEGSHTFSVKATDAVGNTDATPASATWTVAAVTIPPDTMITDKPADPSGSSSASFSFSATEIGATFECRIDNGSYTACMSPATYNGLPDGMHTFLVRATNGKGKIDPTPASYAWMIDTTPPVSSITSPVTGVNMIGTIIPIKGMSSDSGSLVSSVEVSTDGGATWNRTEGTTAWSYEWSIPTDGTYTLISRATDHAGNVEVPGAGSTVTVHKRQPSNVAVSGRQILVNGKLFTMKGVVYSPVPVGDDIETTPPYGDYFTYNYRSIYDRDLPLLRQMGANVLNLSIWDGTEDHLDLLDSSYNNGVQPIYIVAGYWVNSGLDIDPQSPANVRAQVKADFRQMVATHKNHPAILMWAIGNDLNADVMYGADMGNLFSLINEMAAEAHAEEGAYFHPVTTAFADSNLISTISSYDIAVPSLDIWGANVYRGNSFGMLFNEYQAVSSKPLAILGYGIDAFDNVHGDEYENIGTPQQAIYAEALWNEIKMHSDVCIGGSIKEYSDEWWKGKYSSDPGCPDNNPALHSACGYVMSDSPDGYGNEEWWGIMRPGINPSGADTMETRVLYYTLQELWVESTNAPQISVNPNVASFGSVAVGGTAPVQTFTISNTGTENLAISTITISGTHSSEFITQEDHCSGHVLIPSKTCTLQVVFSATTAGEKSATLSIFSDDPTAPILYVGFTGTATVAISGTVTAGQSPLSGVTMTLSGAASATTITDSSGAYTFTGLVNGSYTITPGRIGYVFTPANKAVTINNAGVIGRNFTGALITFTVTPSSGNGGSISPSTPQTVDYGGTVSFTVVPGADYRITDVMVDGISQGAISSYTFNNVIANHTIDASFASTGSALKFGVFGATSVSISGGGYVDSYDSSKGPYGGAHGSNGAVGTNSTANNAINLSAGSIIYGDAWVGPGGDPNRVIVASGGALVYGNKGALSSAKDMTPKADPGGGTSTTFGNGKTLTSGTYRVSSVNLSGGGIGTINGNVTLYVTGSMTVSGSAKIVITPGSSLTVYVSGSMNISGGGVVNQTLNPHKLVMYGTSTCTTANYSGGSSLYGLIHAPNAKTAISGGTSVYGSVVGKSVTISGGSVVHCDESL